MTAPTRTSDGLLRFAMRLDALLVGIIGIPFIALAGQIESITGVPWTFDLGLGIFFVAYGVVFYALAGRERVRPGGIAIVTANALFTVFFVGLVLGGVWPLTGWGCALLLGGAVYTAVIGAVQYAGLRRLDEA